MKAQYLLFSILLISNCFADGLPNALEEGGPPADENGVIQPYVEHFGIPVDAPAIFYPGDQDT